MPLRVEQRDRVAILTLDDPDRRNALESGARRRDHRCRRGVRGRRERRRARGHRGTAGILLRRRRRARSKSMSGQDASHVRSIYDGFLSIRDCPLPTVAAVNGPAVGAGFNLALCCDVRIAGASARFDARFTRIGLHPGGGHVWMLERELGPQATAAITLFGERVDGRASHGARARRGAASPTTSCSTARSSSRPRAPRSRAISPRSVKATLREAPWQPDFESAVQTELGRQKTTFAQGGGSSLARPALGEEGVLELVLAHRPLLGGDRVPRRGPPTRHGSGGTAPTSPRRACRASRRRAGCARCAGRWRLRPGAARAARTRTAAPRPRTRACTRGPRGPRRSSTRRSPTGTARAARSRGSPPR